MLQHLVYLKNNMSFKILDIADLSTTRRNKTTRKRLQQQFSTTRPP